MSCGCKKPDRTNLWTPIPEFHQPTEILPGENIDCYSKRAGTKGKNDVAQQIENKVENTSLTTDLNRKIDEQLKVTPTSTRTPTNWDVTVNGQPIANVLPELSVNPATGKITGTVSEANAGKNFKVKAAASDGDGEIDSREFNLFAKDSSKEDTIKFVNPLPGGKVTCKFGPRMPPAAGASSMHQGVDFAGAKEIVSAADGTVVKAGPASGFGNWVVIEHRNAKNDLVATTVYGHMNTMYVKVGQKVAAGQAIAPVGNAGIGTGAHLHFEMHKGKWKNPVDPMPYINGQMDVAQDNIPGQNGQPKPDSFIPVNNTNRGMTAAESDSANDDCPPALANQSGSGGTQAGPAQGAPEPPSVPVSTSPSKAATQAKIQQALDEDPSLTEADKKHLMFVAKIESDFKADAKNPNSSARGAYQMLDKTAVSYYGKIGIPATEANRNDPYYATKAQIEFYKREQKPYYQEFQNSGTIAGKTPPPDAAARYSTMTQGEFTYGLIHHDGVGNAAAGKDLQGVDYYRKKIRQS